MRHVHATTAAVEKQLRVSVCILALVTQQADRTFSALCLHCHLSVWLNHICPHYLISGTTFAGNSLYIKCIFHISPHLSQTFFILRKNQQDNIINVHRSSCKVAVILVRF